VASTTSAGAAALRGLHEVLEQLPPGDAGPVKVSTWRWQVRQRMAAVRDLLVAEACRPDRGGGADGGLEARGAAARRQRDALLRRLGELGPRVLGDADPRPVRDELRRLLVDVHHHVQRTSDLAYDAVEMELGGGD